MTVAEKDRAKSVRKRIFGLVSDAEIHKLFTYAQLSEAVGCDVSKNRAAIEGAGRDLLKVRGVGLVCVRGEGYQVMHPDEAPRLMRGKLDRAVGQIKKGQFISDNVDTAAMSETVKKGFSSVAHEMAVIGTEMKQAQRRLDFHARTLAAHGQTLTVHDDRITRLENRTEDEIAAIARKAVEDLITKGREVSTSGT